MAKRGEKSRRFLHYLGLGVAFCSFLLLITPLGYITNKSEMNTRGVLYGVVGLVGLVVAAIAWVRSRAFPPGFCKCCGYCLKGNDGGTCPECGYTEK